MQVWRRRSHAFDRRKSSSVKSLPVRWKPGAEQERSWVGGTGSCLVMRAAPLSATDRSF